MKKIWIVEGRVTDPDAHNGKAKVGDVEWQFSDGPPGERGSSADYLSIEEGMRANPDCEFVFIPEPDGDKHGYDVIIRLRIPASNLWSLFDTSPTKTITNILSEALYDDYGLTGSFTVENIQPYEGSEYLEL